MNRRSPIFTVATLATLAALLGGGMVAPSALAAGLQGYTDEASWAAGLSLETETFDDADWSDSALAVDLTGGGAHRVYTDALGVHAAGVYSGVLEDRVNSARGRYTVITFTQAVSAFSAQWDVSLAGTGEGLRIWVNAGNGDESIDVAVSGSGFFGFRSSGSFSELRIRGAGLGGALAEGYSMDNAQFGSPAAAVPEPATLLMWVAGLGLGANLRRRRALCSQD